MNNPCVLCDGNVLYPDGLNLKKNRKHRGGTAHRVCYAKAMERAAIAHGLRTILQNAKVMEGYVYLTGQGVPALEAARLANG